MNQPNIRMYILIQAASLCWFCARSTIAASNCMISTIVYCPYSGLTAVLQAIVLSDVIENEFTVQWSGSPALCVHPSNRHLCIVDASMCYNSGSKYCAPPHEDSGVYSSTASPPPVDPSFGSVFVPEYSVAAIVGISIGSLLGLAFGFVGCGLLLKTLLREKEYVPGPVPIRKY